MMLIPLIWRITGALVLTDNSALLIAMFKVLNAAGVLPEQPIV